MILDCLIYDNLNVGIACYYSHPAIVNCLIFNNSASSGAGVFLFYSHPKITNCTITANTAETDGGGIGCAGDSSPRITNCILWGNSPDQLYAPDGQPVVTYCAVELGYPGRGNITADPAFVDPDGGDYRLRPRSPCIDAADNTAVPPMVTDDLDGHPRFVDDPDTVDTGYGDPPLVDMGAYEFQLAQTPGDLDGDGCVDQSDLGILLADWGCTTGDCPGDCDDDGDTDQADLGVLLAHWGEGCD